MPVEDEEGRMPKFEAETRDPEVAPFWGPGCVVDVVEDEERGVRAVELVFVHGCLQVSRHTDLAHREAVLEDLAVLGPRFPDVRVPLPHDIGDGKGKREHELIVDEAP